MTRLALLIALTLSTVLSGCTDSPDDTSDPDGSGVDGAASHGGPDGATVMTDGGTTGPDGGGEACPAPPESLCRYVARIDDLEGHVDTDKAQAWADTYLAGQCMEAYCSLANGDIWHGHLCGPSEPPVAAPCASLCDVAINSQTGVVDGSVVDAWRRAHLTGQCMDAVCPLPGGGEWTQNLCGPAGW